MQTIKRNVPYFYVPARAIFEGTNSKMTKTMTNRVHLCTEFEEVQLGREWAVEYIFTQAESKD